MFSKSTRISKPQAKNSSTETEEALGSLPYGWTIFKESNGRYLFIDHNQQATTWIDPRTKKLRQADIALVAEGELPYGWEEIYDENFGYYYADHNTQTNYQHPPWSKATRDPILKKREEAANEAKKVANFAVEALQKKSKSKENLLLDDDTRAKNDVEKLKTKLADVKSMEESFNKDVANSANDAKQTQKELEKYEYLLNLTKVQRKAIEDELVSIRSEIENGTSPQTPLSPINELKLKQKKLEQKESQDTIEDERALKISQEAENRIRAEEDEQIKNLEHEESLALVEHEEAMTQLEQFQKENSAESNADNEEVKSKADEFKEALEKAKNRLTEIKSKRETREGQIAAARKAREELILAELAQKKRSRADTLLKKLEEERSQKLIAEKKDFTATFANDAERKRQAVAEAMKKKEEETLAELNRKKALDEAEIEQRRQILKQKDLERQERVKKIEQLTQKLDFLQKQHSTCNSDNALELMELELDILCSKKMIQTEIASIKKLKSRNRKGSDAVALNAATIPEFVKKAGSLNSSAASTPKTPRINIAERQSFAEKMQVIVNDGGLEDALKNVARQ